MDRIRALVQQHVNSAVVLQELKQAFPSWPSLSCQAMLAGALVYDATYPLSSRYYRYLLKVIMKDIEVYNNSISIVDDEHGIDDSLAALVVKCQLLVDDIDDTCYMQFSTTTGNREAGNEVKIQVFRSHNQVGCRLWDAGLFMSAFMISNCDMLRGRRVVELGAGVGMSAITYAAAAEAHKIIPKSVVISDFHNDVLLLIKSNILINKHLFPSIDISVARVDWADLHGLSRAIPYPPDFIFAADCTYSSDLHSDLVASIESLLCGPGRPRSARSVIEDASFSMDSFLSSRVVAIDDSNGDYLSVPICMIASCRRTEDTYSSFLHVLQSNEALASVDITTWALDMCADRLYYYSHIELLRIRLIVPVE